MWYYQKNDAAEGPLEEQQIVDLIRSGVINRETFVWTEGMEEWSAAGSTGLVGYLRSVPPPIKRDRPAPSESRPIPSASAMPPTIVAVPQRFHDPRNISSWLTVLLVLYVVFQLAAIWSSWLQLDLLNRMLNREQILDLSAAIKENDARERIIGLSEIGMFIFTAIVFGRWIYVVAKNTRALGAQNLEFSPGWAVGYYFVPFLNLWKPYRAMKEIWNASENPDDWKGRKGNMILRRWWAFWIISCLVGQGSLRVLMNAHNVDQYITATWASIFGAVAEIVVSVLAICLIIRLSAIQVNRARACVNQTRQ